MKKFKSPWRNCSSEIVAPNIITPQITPNITAPKTPHLLGAVKDTSCNLNENTNFFLQFNPDQLIPPFGLPHVLSVDNAICRTLNQPPYCTDKLYITGNNASANVGTKDQLELYHKMQHAEKKWYMAPPSGKRLGIYNVDDGTYCSREMRNIYAIVVTNVGIFKFPFTDSKKEKRLLELKDNECKTLGPSLHISGDAIPFLNTALEGLFKNVELFYKGQQVQLKSVYVSNHGSFLPSFTLNCGPELACDHESQENEWLIGSLIASVAIGGVEFIMPELVVLESVVNDVEEVTVSMLFPDFSEAGKALQIAQNLNQTMNQISKAIPSIVNLQNISMVAGTASAATLITKYAKHWESTMKTCFPKCWLKNDVITSVNGFSVHTPFERNSEFMMYGKPNSNCYRAESNVYKGDNRLKNLTLQLNKETFKNISIKTQNGCEMTNDVFSFTPSLLLQLAKDLQSEHPDFTVTLIRGQQQWHGHGGETNPLTPVC